VIGLKEIQRKKLQFALIALVVTLIAYLVLMINGLGNGLNIRAGSALLDLDADAVVYSSASGLSVIRSELPSSVVEEVGNMDGVTASSPLGYLSVNAKIPDGDIEPIALLGFLPDQLGEPKTINGEPLTSEDKQGVLVGSRFLKSSNLAIGDTLTFFNRLETYDFTIIGEVSEGYFFFQPAVYLLLDSLREVKYGVNSPDTPLASVVLIKGDDLIGTKTADFEIVSKQTAFANIEGVEGQQQTVNALRLFGFLIGAMVVGIFFYVLTLQKIQQVGIIKALGASNIFLFKQMLLQVLTIIVIGVIISAGVAYGTYSLLNRLPQTVPVSFTIETFLITSVLFIVTGLTGLIFSLRKVSKVDPIIAIGQQQ